VEDACDRRGEEDREKGRDRQGDRDDDHFAALASSTARA
jgi:hypothetical protein